MHLQHSSAHSSFYVSAQVILETGEIGRQANGAVMATLGETVCSKFQSSPLTDALMTLCIIACNSAYSLTVYNASAVPL